MKNGFIKGETRRLLRTNSLTIKEKFESNRWDLKLYLVQRGYPPELHNKIPAEVNSRHETTLSNTIQLQRYAKTGSGILGVHEMN